jgi:hypothetical protein
LGANVLDVQMTEPDSFECPQCGFRAANRNVLKAAFYIEGWQDANHAWQDWLDKYIPNWDASDNFDAYTLPKQPSRERLEILYVTVDGTEDE